MDIIHTTIHGTTLGTILGTVITTLLTTTMVIITITNGDAHQVVMDTTQVSTMETMEVVLTMMMVLFTVQEEEDLRLVQQQG